MTRIIFNRLPPGVELTEALKNELAGRVEAGYRIEIHNLKARVKTLTRERDQLKQENVTQAEMIRALQSEIAKQGMDNDNGL